MRTCLPLDLHRNFYSLCTTYIESCHVMSHDIGVLPRMTSDWHNRHEFGNRDQVFLPVV